MNSKFGLKLYLRYRLILICIQYCVQYIQLSSYEAVIISTLPNGEISVWITQIKVNLRYVSYHPLNNNNNMSLK